VNPDQSKDSDQVPAHPYTTHRVKTPYTQYQSIVDHLDRDPLSDRSVHSHLNELTMLGILNRIEFNEGRAGGIYYEYELAVNLNTVQSALAEVRALEDIQIRSGG